MTETAGRESLDLDALERFIRGHPINHEQSKAVALNVARLIDRVRDLEAENGFRIKVVRQYVGHHSSCQECYAVWLSSPPSPAVMGEK